MKICSAVSDEKLFKAIADAARRTIADIKQSQ